MVLKNVSGTGYQKWNSPRCHIKEQTHPRNRVIHQNSEREGKGNFKLIANQAVPTKANCRNGLQCHIMAK